MKTSSSVLLVLTSVLLTACAGGAGKTVKMHGNFCGPNHPRLQAKNLNDATKELSSVSPIDDLDALCKAHDMCYVNKGVGNHICDGKLRSELSSLAYNTASNQCDRKINRMAAGLTAVTPMLLNDRENQKITVSNATEKATNLANSLLEKTPWLMAYAIVLPLNALPSKKQKNDDTGLCIRQSNKRGYYGNN